MPSPYDELAAHLQASTSSQPAKDWLQYFHTYITKWPSTSMQPNVLRFPNIMSHAPAGDIIEYVPQPAPSLPTPTAQSIVMQTFLTAAAKDLRAARVETRQRADRAFNVALGLGIAGGLAPFAGIGLALTGTIGLGVTSGITGGVSSIFSNVFAKLYRSENADLRQMVRDLRRIEEAGIGLWLADQITDADARNEAIRALIDRSGPNTKA